MMQNRLSSVLRKWILFLLPAAFLLLLPALPVKAAGATDGIVISQPASGTYSIDRSDSGVVITLNSYIGDSVIFYKKYTGNVAIIVNGVCSVKQIHVSGAATELAVNAGSALITDSITQFEGSLLIRNDGIIGTDKTASIGSAGPMAIVNTGIINAADICAQAGDLSISGGALNAASISAEGGIGFENATVNLTNDSSFTILANTGNITVTDSSITAAASTYAMYTVRGKIVLSGCMITAPAETAVKPYKDGQTAGYFDSDNGLVVRSKKVSVRRKQ
jgi:hypothetical protein